MTNENQSADFEEESGLKKKSVEKIKEEASAKLKRYDRNIRFWIRVTPVALGVLASILAGSFAPIVFALGLATALYLAYWGLSYRFWDPVLGNEIAFLSLFGQPVDDLDDGIPYAPPVITTVVRYSRPIRQREFPAEPNMIYEGEMKDADDLRKLPPGFKPPIRITFRDHLPEELVKKIILEEDRVVLDLQKMEPQDVKTGRLEAMMRGNSADSAEEQEPRKDWGMFTYRELRHLEKLGGDKRELASKKDVLEKDLYKIEEELVTLDSDAPNVHSLKKEKGKIKRKLKSIDDKLAEIASVYPGVFHDVKFYAGDPIKTPEEPTGDQEKAVEALNRRVTAMVVPVVRWMINDPIKFYLEIGSDIEVNRQIEDEMISVLQRLLPKISVGQALENINWINAHLYIAVIKRTLKWGIKVEGAFQKQIKFNHGLNTAIAALPEAIYQGEAEGQRAARKGKGVASAARALERETLTGRAEGMDEIKDKLGIEGSEVQSAEVARDVADGGNAIVLGSGGMSDLVGIAAAAAFGKKDKKTDPEPKPVEADPKPESDKEE